MASPMISFCSVPQGLLKIAQGLKPCHYQVLFCYGISPAFWECWKSRRDDLFIERASPAQPLLLFFSGAGLDLSMCCVSLRPRR